MPYITKDQREALKTRQPLSAGELNYAMCMLAVEYVKAKGLSYQAISDVLGAFNGGCAEFYRVVAIPYEQGKRAVNGDVWGV